MNVLLLSPACPDTFWSYRHALRFIRRKALLPPLGLLTVAAMLPRHWRLRLFDLNVARLPEDAIAWADVVFISAMTLEEASARRLIARCQAAGKRVVAGGPLFTTGHERFSDVDHLVLGEAEDIMPRLVDDLTSGTPQRVYTSAHRPDVTATPVPRWDLINFNDYAVMPVQFSRGCPFDCEFCDITVMYGRTPRTKSPAQVTAELDALLDAGWSGTVFVVDDNFIGHRPRAAAMLRELAAWRQRRAAKTTFITEASLNLADSDELLDLMARAGFKRVFVGIETPNEQSLVECAKAQNLRRDLAGSVRRIQQAGLEVMGGFIVGFDNDGPGVFEQQWRFIQESGIVTAMVGLLTALPRTRLFTRLKEEGRILHESTGNNFDTMLNFIPRLDRDELLNGYRALLRRLYAPREFYQRAITFLQTYQPRPPHAPLEFNDLVAFVKSLWVMGVWSRGRRAFWRYLTYVLIRHRAAFAEAVNIAIRGHHFRKLAARV